MQREGRIEAIARDPGTPRARCARSGYPTSEEMGALDVKLGAVNDEMGAVNAAGGCECRK